MWESLGTCRDDSLEKRFSLLKLTVEAEAVSRRGPPQIPPSLRFQTFFFVILGGRYPNSERFRNMQMCHQERGGVSCVRLRVITYKLEGGAS